MSANENSDGTAGAGQVRELDVVSFAILTRHLESDPETAAAFLEFRMRCKFRGSDPVGPSAALLQRTYDLFRQFGPLSGSQRMLA